jgi:Family of unknown function (DUF6152)
MESSDRRNLISIDGLRCDMKRKLPIILTLAVSFLVAQSTVFAHHGNAAYDDKAPVTFKGTVTDFLWVNPHVQVYLDVKSDQGEVVHWGCETVSPSKLFRSGWTRDSLKSGDQVTVTVFPAKSHAPVGLIRKVVLANGKELGTEEQPQ